MEEKKIERLVADIGLLIFCNKRSSREMWSEKPWDVQEKDIMQTERILRECLKAVKKLREVTT